jgi:hypothetical protein
MTGYEKSPDYGGPQPTWLGSLFLILLVATIVGAFFLAFGPL